MSEIYFTNRSYIKTLEPKEFKRGKALTDTEYRIMLEMEFLGAELNTDNLIKDLGGFNEQNNSCDTKR